MSVATGQDIPHSTFCGTLTEVGPSNMPSGGSPQNQNVEFLAGLVRTRGGLNPKINYSGIVGGPWNVRYIKSYQSIPEQPVTLALLVNPTTNPEALIANSPTTTIGSIYGYGAQLPWAPFSLNGAFQGPLAKSCTQFSREYIAVSEGRYGYDLPRQWDGTFFDRVSQCGVGQAPIAADSTQTQGIINIVQYSSSIAKIYEIDNIVYVIPTALPFYGFLDNFVPGDLIEIAGVNSSYNGTSALLATIPGINGFSFQATATGFSPVVGTGTIYWGIATVTTAAPFDGAVSTGGTLTIAGVSPSGYNGVWPVRSINSNNGIPVPTAPANIYVSNLGLAASGVGGTIAAPGSISMGLHGVSVSFITRQGYITKPAPPNFWTAAGSLKADINFIPIGPSNTVARLLMFTPYLTPPAQTGTFYSVRQTDAQYTTVMQINDNTTTLLTVDFSDSDLTTGFNAEYLFSLVELGECAGSFPYAGRMFWWGELNSMQDFLNMEFNGGWELGGGIGSSDVPLGWTSDPTYGAGGARVADGGAWLDAYQITGLSGAGPNGMITQSAFQNYLKNALLVGGVSFSARVTAKASNGANTLVLDIYSATGGGVLASINWGSWASGYFTQIVEFSAKMPAVIPADTVIRLYALNLATGQTITVDRIEPFPTNQAINYTVLRASYASDPESFDGVTGLIQPVYNNGEAVRNVYTVRDSMYIVCDRSTYVTKDVAGSEPASWTVDPVSSTVGTVGAQAVGIGEDWVVKANRYGLYIYLGREPEKISQEIQSLWNKQGFSNIINWKYAYLIWVTVDLQQKQILIGAPVNGSTFVNQIFMMDYQTLDTSEMLAQYPTLRFSPYTGRRVILEQGRKWTIWNFNRPDGTVLPIPCGAFVEQTDGTAQLLLGNGSILSGSADSNTYFIDSTKRGNDNGAAVNSRYTTHFFPTEDEEQQLQLRSHMHLFSFLRGYINGSGNIGFNLYRNTLAVSPTNPRQFASAALLLAALQDIEKTVDNATCERWAVEWFTNSLDSWWSIERFTRTIETDPNGLIRGVNMQ